MHRNNKLIVGLAFATLGLTSCKEDYFDQERYDQTIREAFPVDNVDPTHTWSMFGTAIVDVSVSNGSDATYRVAVYKENPNAASNLTQFAKSTVTAGKSVRLTFSYPLANATAYISIYDNENHRATRQVTLKDMMAVSVDFFGAPSADARATRANTGDDYPNTSDGINANANEWADPNKYFGGWLVPDPLTAEQKTIVKAYFQANPNLTYEDPEWRHFFVQQVYTGGTNPAETGNKEDNVAADGSTHYTSANMNLLTVGYDEKHINNFNSGTYSGAGLNTYQGGVNQDGSVNVLDKGFTVNDFAEHHHPDQIMLMVNINDTRCMGYHNTGCSLQKNDKAALVDWTVIRTWANANGYNGELLNDGWNRSFVGFDFELYTLEQSYAYESGNIVYAKFSDGQNGGLGYVWDGSEVLTKGTKPSVDDLTDKNLTSKLASANMWAGWDGETITYENGVYTYIAKGTDRGFDINVGDQAWATWDSDWTIYEKLVIDFATPAPAGGKFCIKNNYNDAVSVDFTEGATTVELPINSSLTNVGQVYMQNYGVGTFNISSITLVAGSASNVPQVKYYDSDYLLVDGKQVPLLITNTNMYGGTRLTISDDDMKTTQDGKQCFNMAKIAQLVNAGYLPIINKNLREWVKWQGGDGYFSDWIVTLSKAQRAGLDEDGSHDEEHVTELGYRFCFEDNFPSAGDYDFNDVVITVSPTIKDNVVTMKVSLDAVGATKVISAAMRIKDLHDSYIESVTCTGNMDDGLASTPGYINATDNGRNVFVVPVDKRAAFPTDFTMRLFSDAHWTLGGEALVTTTGIDRYMLNTIKNGNTELEEKYSRFPVREVTYTFTLKDKEYATLFTQDNLDVFIVEAHNSIKWEVHTVPFKLDQVLMEYANNDKLGSYSGNTKNFPWAICAPASFRYPIEWHSICGSKLKLTEEYGYNDGQEPYSGFAEWAADHTKNIGWYDNPNLDLVY